ncbi:MAG: hypothetical protein ABH827_06475 [bacterium]
MVEKVSIMFMFFRKNVQELSLSFVFFVLFSCFLSCVHADISNLAQAHVTAEIKSEIKKDDLAVKPKTGGIANFDPNDFAQLIQKILNDFQTREMERRRVNKEILPEALKTVLGETEAIYTHFVDYLNVERILLFWGTSVSGQIEDAQQAGTLPAEDCVIILQNLEKLQDGLLNKSFKRLINLATTKTASSFQMGALGGALSDGNPTAMISGVLGGAEEDLGLSTESVDQYSEQDLADLLKSLAVLKPFILSLSVPVQDTFTSFYDLLKSVKEKDFGMVATVLLKSITPLMVQARLKIQKTFDLFEDYVVTHFKEFVEQEKLSSQQKKDKKSDLAMTLDQKRDTVASVSDSKKLFLAIRYWQKGDLNRFLQTLRVFESVQKSARLQSPEELKDLFRFFAYGFDFARNLYEKYAQDMAVKKGNPGFVKRLMIPGLMLPYTADYVVRTSMSAWMFFDTRADFRKGILFDTLLGGKKASAVTPAALLMHNVFAMGYAAPVFFKPSFWQMQPGDLLKSYGEIFTSFTYYHLFHVNLFSKPGETKELWPRDYKYLKEAILRAAYQTNASLGRFFSRKVWEYGDPFTISMIESSTWGIIKPEMLSSIMNAFLPIVLQKCFPEKVANFSDAYLARKTGYDGDSVKYLEERAIRYILSSVGEHWSRILFKKYTVQIVSVASTVSDWGAGFLSAIGLLSNDALQDWRDSKKDVANDLNAMLDMGKEVIKGVFTSSGPRLIVINFLTEKGYLEEGETDQALINRVILRYVIDTFLFQYHLLTSLEASLVFRKIRTIQTNDEQAFEQICNIIDGLVDAVKGNLIAASGAWGVGKIIDGWICPLISEKYGPLYKTVPEKVRSWTA